MEFGLDRLVMPTLQTLLCILESIKVGWLCPIFKHYWRMLDWVTYTAHKPMTRTWTHLNFWEEIFFSFHLFIFQSNEPNAKDVFGSPTFLYNFLFLSLPLSICIVSVLTVSLWPFVLACVCLVAPALFFFLLLLVL